MAVRSQRKAIIIIYVTEWIVTIAFAAAAASSVLSKREAAASTAYTHKSDSLIVGIPTSAFIQWQREWYAMCGLRTAICVYVGACVLWADGWL